MTCFKCGRELPADRAGECEECELGVSEIAQQITVRLDWSKIPTVMEFRHVVQDILHLHVRFKKGSPEYNELRKYLDE